jgi:Tfp pilus assembly protein FimT
VVICAKTRDQRSDGPERGARQRRLRSQHRLRRLRRAGTRGFTIAELLTVVGVIGVMAALSAPVFVQMMRDRRVQQAGLQMRDLVRLARSRALGRGAAHVVRWDASVTGSTTRLDGQLQVREAIAGSTDVCAPWPSASCNDTLWLANTSTTSAYSRPVSAFDQEVGPYDNLEVKMVDAGGNTINYAEICFTPRGNTYMRTVKNDLTAFSRLSEIPRFQLKNTKTGRQSVVIISPNGEARLRSRIN